MREKLIELLDDIQRFGAGYTDFELYGMRVPDEVFNNEVADNLIANGVTIPVRCKDCNNFVPESITVCRHCAITKMQVVDEDDFCSYGERRTDA